MKKRDELKIRKDLERRRVPEITAEKFLLGARLMSVTGQQREMVQGGQQADGSCCLLVFSADSQRKLSLGEEEQQRR
jgi:hypothetical protein